MKKISAIGAFLYCAVCGILMVQIVLGREINTNLLMAVAIIGGVGFGYAGYNNLRKK